jgi:hypothetical protein
MYSINNQRFKIPVDFIPIVPDSLACMKPVKPDIDQDSAFVKDFISIIDRESLFKRLRGTRGRKVDKMMKNSGQ